LLWLFGLAENIIGREDPLKLLKLFSVAASKGFFFSGEKWCSYSQYSGVKKRERERRERDERERERERESRKRKV